MMMPRALLLLTLETGTLSITTGREGGGNSFLLLLKDHILEIYNSNLNLDE